MRVLISTSELLPLIIPVITTIRKSRIVNYDGAQIGRMTAREHKLSLERLCAIATRH